VALQAEHFELAWVVVFDGSDSRQSCGWYGSPQHLDHRHAPKTIKAKETAKVVKDFSLFSFFRTRLNCVGIRI
jgi:hypothetical protein